MIGHEADIGRAHLLEQALDVSSVGIAVVDHGGVVQAASAAFHRTIGTEDLVGRPLAAVIPHAAAAIDAARAVVRADPAGRVPISVAGPTPGRRIRIEVHGVADDAGFAGAVVSAAVEPLVADESFRALVDRSSDVIIVLDADRHINYVTPSVERRFGFAPGDLTGRDVVAFVHPGDADVVARRLTQLIAEPDAELRYEARQRCRDGTYRWVDVVATSHRPDPASPGAVLAFRDVTERRAAAEQLEHRATHDALTGLPNRVLLLDRLEMALARAERSVHPIAVLFLDLDNFKEINDTRGHAAGDRILIDLAGRLREVIRPSDTLCRFAGDEFVVLCEDADRAAAEDIARRIERIMAQPYAIDDRHVKLSASLGIALADNHRDPEALLRDADAAMYRAKDLGKSRSVLFDDTIKAPDSGRWGRSAELREAIERDQFRLLYQPIFDIRTQEIRGVEALLRWERRDELVPAAAFMGHADESGLILPIGAWALTRACHQAQDWRLRFPERRLPVTVNISPRQLASGDALRAVERALASGGLAADRLTLDIPATALLDRTVWPTVEALAGLGVRLVVDEVGESGVLESLTRLRLHGVKLDRDLVGRLDRGGYASSAALVRMAKIVDLDTTAAGVETEAQLRFLRDLGVGSAQGYHLGSPVLPAVIERMLASPPGP